MYVRVQGYEGILVREEFSDPAHADCMPEPLLDLLDVIFAPALEKAQGIIHGPQSAACRREQSESAGEPPLGVGGVPFPDNAVHRYTPVRIRPFGMHRHDLGKCRLHKILPDKPVIVDLGIQQKPWSLHGPAGYRYIIAAHELLFPALVVIHDSRRSFFTALIIDFYTGNIDVIEYLTGAGLLSQGDKSYVYTAFVLSGTTPDAAVTVITWGRVTVMLRQYGDRIRYEVDPLLSAGFRNYLARITQLVRLQWIRLASGAAGNF